MLYYRALCRTVTVLMLVALPFAGASPIKVWLSDPSANIYLEPQADLSFSIGGPPGEAVIAVDEARRYQTMLGFGASFTDSSAYLVQKELSAKTSNRLLQELFDPDAGIGLSLIRQPLAASDFAVNGNYSYDDLTTGETDPELKNFSVAHDAAYIIPVLKRALRINPAVEFIGSPWSPPGWMKTSGSMVTGSLTPEAYEPLARYFVRYIEAYQQRGIPTQFITPNNEPLYEPSGYPGMLMRPAEQRRFIRDYLGPALERAGLGTKILTYDHNWDVPSYPETIFSDPQAAALTLGTAWHCYGGAVKAQTAVHNSFPEKEAHLTECSGGEWQGAGETAFAATLGLMINSPREWSRSVVLWNMVLDEANGPTNSGCVTCRGVMTVSRQNGSYWKTVDYYALGHISKFVRRGAVRIGSSPTPGVDHVAFSNPDGSKVLLTHNTGDTPTTFRVVWGARAFTYTLPAGAAATFVWTGDAAGSTPGYTERAGRTDITFTSPEDQKVVLSYGEDLAPYSQQIALGRSSLSYTLPVGASLSQGQTVTLPTEGWQAIASASADDDAPKLALDHDPETRWSSGKGQANGDWFELDLGRRRTFSRLTLDAGVSAGDFVRGYQLYVSDDGHSWGSAVAGGPGTGQVLDITFPKQRGRYVRVVATVGAGNWWSVAEARLYRQHGPGAALTSAESVRQKRFVSPAGRRGLAAYNPAGRAATFALPTWHGQSFRYTLPPHAAALFIPPDGTSQTRPPVLTGLEPPTGLAGSSVTLTGRRFGSFQGVSTVKFGEALAPVEVWSDTKVTATIPVGLMADEPEVSVLVNGHLSNPRILSLLDVTDAVPRESWQGTASASADGEPVSNMLDGDLSTRWSTGEAQTLGQTLTIDLGRPTRFSRLVLDAGSSTDDYPRQYKVEVSSDGQTWQTLLGTIDGTGPVINRAFSPQRARFLRITQGGEAGSWWSVAELYTFP